MTDHTDIDPEDGLIAAGDTPRIELERTQGEKIGRTLARVTLDPQVRNANVAMAFGGGTFSDRHKPDIVESSAILAEEIARVGTGDLGIADRMLTSQAITLDSLFTEMARRAALNLGEHPHAVDRYARLALKAQSNCRATLEALAKLHLPREQTVKHVHVNDGGQAVVTDHFYHYPGGAENAENDEQSHATGRAGESAALPCSHPLGNGVPITGGERPEPMPDAWRHQSGSA